MANRKPLVADQGQVKQLQSGDYATGAFTPHVLPEDTTIPAGTSMTVSRYIEIPVGVTLEIEADADLEIT